MSRRRTVDPSTLLDPNWRVDFPPDGASPVRAPRPPAPAPTDVSTPIDGRDPLATPPRSGRAFPAPLSSLPTTPLSPRGAPDGGVEERLSEEEADRVGRITMGSLTGGRTETEDDVEDSDSDEDYDDERMNQSEERDDQDPLKASGLPKTFELALSYEDRFEAYVYDILGNATVDQIHRLFKGYMEENILPNGWLGLWRSRGIFGGDGEADAAVASILVEIENVNIEADDEKLGVSATVSLPKRDSGAIGAGVLIKSPVSPNSSIFNRSWNTRDASVETLAEPEAETVLEARGWQIPLLEVHPVFQRHGGAKLTATALEHVRFFYKNIWRSWDCDLAKDEPYASQCLQSRMTLFYDMEEGKVNPEDQEKYEKTVSQYQEVRTQLKSLHDSMDVSDSENELDEADVAQCAALYEREMTLETAIQALENPLLRFLQHDANFSKMKRQLALRMRGDETQSVTHVVAKLFRARMVQALDPDAILEHHPTLTSAMENFCLGDVIHIHEGIYSGISLRSTANGTVIKGQSPPPPSPFLSKRPVQVSGSSDLVLEPLVDEDENSNHPKSDEKWGTKSSTAFPLDHLETAIEVQIPANSHVFVDVDPVAGPVTLSDLHLSHVPRQNDSSSSPRGPETDWAGAASETVVVKRGKLILRGVVLSARCVAISVREGAALEMRDCEIRYPEVAAIVAHPNAEVEIKDVLYNRCAQQIVRSSRLGEVSALEAVNEATD